MAAKRKKSKWKKIVFSLFILLIIIVLIGAKVASNKQPEEIQTVNFKIGGIVEKLTETGNIELLRTVEVKSKIAGTVETILVNEGEEVKKGDVLCIIDPDPTQTLILFQKRSSVDRTRINLDQAAKEVERKRELVDAALISTKEFEDAENAYLIAQNAYNLAKQELEIMEREIETSGSGADERIVSSRVRAPYDGFITTRHIEEGAVVTSGMSSVVAGTNLFQIGDPSTKIIKARISEVDIGKVDVGAEVIIMLDAYPDTSFAGKIRHISPVGSLQQGRNVVTFNAEVEIVDKDPRLKPGMSCDVDVIISTADSVLYLPIESIYEKVEGTEEENNITSKRIIYVKNEEKITPVKKKFLFFTEKSDPLDQFEEHEVTVGLKSASRLRVFSDFDTTTVVALDAEKIFTDLEEREENKQENGENTEDSAQDE